MNKIATQFLLALISFVCYNTSAQTVTFDFKKQAFDRSFPFDQNFCIEFQNANSTMERIELTIWNTTQMHRILNHINRCVKERRKDNTYRCDRPGCNEMQLSQSISKEMLLLHSMIPLPFKASTDTYEEPKGTWKASISFIGKLKPNESYVVEISTGRIEPLTKTEQDAIRVKLKGSDTYKKLVEDLTKQVVDEKTLRYDFITTQFAPRLVADLEPLIKEINPNYRVLEFDPATLSSSALIVTHLLNVHNGFNNLQSALSDINDELPANSDKINWEEFLIKINHGVIGTNTTEFQSAMQYAKGIISNLDNATLKANLEDNLKAHINDLIDMNNKVQNELVNNVFLMNTGRYTSLARTYEADLVQNSKKYLFQNFGYGYANGVTHYTYAAMSVYFRPTNLAIPLRHYSGGNWWLARTSFILGTTVTGDVETSQRRGIVGANNGLLIGLGFRVIPGMTLSSGGFFYYDIPSPVVPRENIKPNLFLSLAVDLDVKTTFKEAFTSKD